MNYSMISYILGWIFNFEAAFMILPGITAIIYREKNGLAFLITMLICLTIGIPLTRRKRKSKVFHAKEGAVTVALSWLVLSIAGALPFIISGSIPHPIDAIFETVSGFTTTGASILSDVEALSHCMLIWRSFTHWIGGMGVLVFILCLLPLTGGYHMNLMKAESPGPSVSKLVPKVQSTAKILYTIYIILTIVEIIFLLIGKMPLFDTLCLSFGTAGTGGFGIKNDSIASYSTYNQVVITVFMILFGINFNLFYFILIGKVKDALRSEELHYYLGIIALCIIVITCNVLPMYKNVLEALRYAGFTVASTITTTGYVVVDYGKWPLLSQMIILVLTFVGASSGSTGGGIKISRIVMYFKSARKELRKALHPHSVQTVEFENQPIDGNVISSIQGYLVIYLIIFVVSLLILSCYKIDFTSAFSAVATCLNNVGPGMNVVGPVGNFSSLSDVSKLVLSFDMLAGRLEIFPMLLLFAPSSWRK